jgi:DNA-binding transcriptional MocR family regulator
VFAALLMGFHNAKSGRCFPSYDRISEAVGCCRQTVATALASLEAAGLLSVANRLLRVRWRDTLAMAVRTRILRTSNCYAFPSAARPAPAESSKSSFQTGTGIQGLNPPLFAALDRLKGAFEGATARSGPSGARTNDKKAASRIESEGGHGEGREA